MDTLKLIEISERISSNIKKDEAYINLINARNAFNKDLDTNKDIRTLISNIRQLQIKLDECSKYGNYHPDYQSTYYDLKDKVNSLLSINSYKLLKTSESTFDLYVDDVLQDIVSLISNKISINSNFMKKGSGCHGK